MEEFLKGSSLSRQTPVKQAFLWVNSLKIGHAHLKPTNENAALILDEPIRDSRLSRQTNEKKAFSMTQTLRYSLALLRE